jgi:hypothetical protein
LSVAPDDILKGKLRPSYSFLLLPSASHTVKSKFMPWNYSLRRVSRERLSQKRDRFPTCRVNVRAKEVVR